MCSSIIKVKKMVGKLVAAAGSVHRGHGRARRLSRAANRTGIGKLIANIINKKNLAGYYSSRRQCKPQRHYSCFSLKGSIMWQPVFKRFDLVAEFIAVGAIHLFGRQIIMFGEIDQFSLQIIE